MTPGNPWHGGFAGIPAGFAGIPAGSLMGRARCCSSHIPASQQKSRDQLSFGFAARLPLQRREKSLEKHLDKQLVAPDISGVYLLQHRSGPAGSGVGSPEVGGQQEFLSHGQIPSLQKHQGLSQGQGQSRRDCPARGSGKDKVWPWFLRLFRICVLGIAGAGAARRDREGIVGPGGRQEGRGVPAESLRLLVTPWVTSWGHPG